MTRPFAIVWFGAALLAAACIYVLLEIDSRQFERYVRNLEFADTADIIFIGSSLTQELLPAEDPPNGILEDGRSTVIRTVNDIPERFSNALLAEAIGAGAETIFLEVSTYTHDYIAFMQPRRLGSYFLRIHELGRRLKRTILFRDIQPAYIERLSEDALLDVARLDQDAAYQRIPISPADTDMLRSLAARAETAGVEVILFVTPQPRSVVEMTGAGEYEAVIAHVQGFADSYDLALWIPEGPWPDDLFRDVSGHLNVRGRQRFQRELARWYGARP